MSEVTPQNINLTFVVLDDANNAIPIAVGDRFYEKLEPQFGDFKGKRLISHYTFEQDWDSWERHPAGEEFVYLLSGQIDFVLEQDGGEEVVSLNTPGQYILVPRGVCLRQGFILPVQCYLSRLVKELKVDRSRSLSNHQCPVIPANLSTSCTSER